MHRENKQPDAGCVDQTWRARVISPLRQHGLTLELWRQGKVKFGTYTRVEKGLDVLWRQAMSTAQRQNCSFSVLVGGVPEATWTET